MSKHILILGVAIMTAFGSTSCKREGCIDEKADNYDTEAKKDDGSCIYSDKQAPTITVHKPDPGMHMIDSNGYLLMPIPINLDLYDNVELSSVEFELNYVNNKDSTVMHYEIPLNGISEYTIDTTYMNTTAIYPISTDHQDHELIIKVEDASGNIATDTAYFFIHYMG